jgi:hypothetical protein
MTSAISPKSAATRYELRTVSTSPGPQNEEVADPTGSSRLTEVDAIVGRLFAPLTQEQQRAVDVTAHAFFTNDQRWPTFQHVEALLDSERLDAKAILATFPFSSGSVRYGAFTSLAWSGNLQDDSNLELTLLGLHHYRGPFAGMRDALERDILRLLQVFIDARRQFLPPPTRVEYLQLTSDDALTALVRLRGVAHALPSPAVLASFVASEPAFFASIGGSSGDAAGTAFTWTITRRVLNYDGVDLDMAKYVLAIVDKHYTPPVPGGRVLPSPLSLPSSLGYLDTEWRLAHGSDTHLVVLPSPERAASLAFDAATREEFLERISSLADVLKCLSVPAGGDPKGGHALERLRAYLVWRLPPESHDQLSRAIDQLAFINDIRNAGGHAAAEAKGARAYRALGIPLPTTEWPAAWQTVRTATIEALDIIRDEVLSSVDAPAK